MKRIIHLTAALLASALVFLLASCVTVPTADTIPADLSAAKFFQTVQEQIDADQFDAALVYLGEFRKRFGTSTDQGTLDRMVEADYLTAHIAYSRGNLDDARAQFAALLKQYDTVPDEAASPPRWIKILCKRLIENLDKKIGPKPAVPPAPDATTVAPPAAEPTKP